MLIVKKYNLKSILLLVLGIVCVFILVAYSIVFIKNEFFSVNESDVTLSSNNNIVLIKDNLSINDEYGKEITDSNANTFGFIEFEVVNHTTEKRNFQVYLTESPNSNINPNYIKLYLTDTANKPLSFYAESKLPSYVDLNYLMNKPNSKLLYSGVLNGEESKNYRLRVWLTDSYVVENSDKVFQFVIDARAV